MVGRSSVVGIEAGGARGTGFLIQGGGLVTALHVVAEIESGRVTTWCDPVTLHYVVDGTSLDSEKLTEYKPIAFDVVEDWVVLEVEGDPRVSRWEAAQVGSESVANDWHTYGFPSDAGMATHGRLTAVDAPRLEIVDFERAHIPAMQLYSVEAAAGRGQPMPGYSGAPVVMNGRVVGLLRRAPNNREGVAAGGVLFACPIERVMRTLGRKALKVLLQSLFDANGLRKWVYHHATPLYNELPERPCSHPELASAVVERGVAHGVIGSQFFQELIAGHSGRRDEILGVAAQWLPPHEHDQLVSVEAERVVATMPPDAAAPGMTPPAAPPSTRPPPAPWAHPDPEAVDKFLLDFRFVLDRSHQWSELQRLCAEPHAHFTCLLHGDASQDVHLFVERIERFLTDECPQSHKIHPLPFEVEYSRALTVAEWEQRICAVVHPPAASLVQALQTMTASEPVLLIFGSRPLRGLDGSACDALTKLLGVHLPKALAAASPSHGVRLLVTIEHEEHATSLSDPLTSRVYHALSQARDAGLPFQELIELTLPPWLEVEKQLRETLRLAPGHPFLNRCKAEYERVAHDKDPHRRSFVRLADELNHLIKTYFAKR